MGGATVLQHVSRKMSVAVQVRASIALSALRDAPSKTAALRIGSTQKRKWGKVSTAGSSQSAHQTASVMSSITWFDRRCLSHAVTRPGPSRRRLVYRKSIDTEGNNKIATARAGTTELRFIRDAARRSAS